MFSALAGNDSPSTFQKRKKKIFLETRSSFQTSNLIRAPANTQPVNPVQQATLRFPTTTLQQEQKNIGREARNFCWRCLL